MSDLRVDTRAIEASYLRTPAAKEVWNVSAVWDSEGKANKKLLKVDASGAAGRVVDGVISLFQAQNMRQHRQAVELFDQSLLWDGPPIRISNKGHLRLATYLFKFFAHLSVTPVAMVVAQPSPGRHLIELDACVVSRPHRVWWLPATLLLPSEVPKNVHFKIGVNNGLEDGKVELFTGRLTNLPPFVPEPVRTINGILMGAVPHALEEVLGFFFDFVDGDSYYAEKRHTTFTSRHPDSTTPALDYAQDVLADAGGWVQQQAVVGFESAQAVFGKSFNNVAEAVQAVINFYAWLLSTLWSVVTSAGNSAADLLGAGGQAFSPSDNTIRAAPAVGGGAKVYKGPAITAAASPAVPGRA